MHTCTCDRCGLEGIEAKAGEIPGHGDYGPGMISDVAAAWKSRIPVRMISVNSGRDAGVELATGTVSNIRARVDRSPKAQTVGMLVLLTVARILHIDEASYRPSGRASSTMFSLLVAPIIGTSCRSSNPSISVRTWGTTFSVTCESELPRRGGRRVHLVKEH